MLLVEPVAYPLVVPLVVLLEVWVVTSWVGSAPLPLMISISPLYVLFPSAEPEVAVLFSDPLF